MNHSADKRITIMLVLGMLVGILHATDSSAQVQSAITGIKHKLSGATGKQRFDLLNDLAWEYRFAYPDTSIILSTQAYALGKMIATKKDLARALNITGIANNYNGNKMVAYEYYNKAMAVAVQQQDSTELAYTYNNLGRLFQEQGLMDKAFPNIYRASEIFRKLNDSTGLAYCYQSLGYLYQAQRNFTKAAECYSKGLQLRIKLQSQRNIQGGYHILGRLYAEQGLADESLRYLLKADSVGRKQGDEIQLAETWIYMAKSYLSKGLVKKADSLLTVSLKIIQKTKNVRILSNALLIGGEIAIANGNMNKANRLLTQALDNSRHTGDHLTPRDVYFQLWKISEIKKDRIGALFNQNQYLLIGDTLKNLDVVRQEEELNFARTILQREAENQKLKIENKLIDQDRELQSYLFVFCVLFILIAGTLVWLNTKRLKSISVVMARKNDALLQMNHEKDAIMSVVAHDLKSPLNKIRGLIMLLKIDGQLSSGQMEYIQLIDRVLLDGTTFISDLLSVHALEENQLPELSEFNAAELIRDKTDASIGMATNKKIKLKMYLEKGVRVISDKEYLGRIVDNLVSNAIKFSPEDSEVELTLEKKRNQFVIAVEDKGPGFSESDKKKMFKRFSKLSARPTAGETSNGLGLAIVKTLVDRLGGFIELESAKGIGTKFIVRLPGVQSERSTMQEQAKVVY